VRYRVQASKRPELNFLLEGTGWRVRNFLHERRIRSDVRGFASSLDRHSAPTLERFTEAARKVLVLAEEEARLLNHSFIGTEHILLGLIHDGDGPAARALESLDISLKAVRQEVKVTIGKAKRSPTGSLPFTPTTKKVLALSLRAALQLDQNSIGTEHLLLGLVREGEGVAAKVLVHLGANLDRLGQRVVMELSGFQILDSASSSSRAKRDDMTTPESGPAGKQGVLPGYGQPGTASAFAGSWVLAVEVLGERLRRLLASISPSGGVAQ
jgi:ATP-dependent Clp protease ATP-binding subunit ClpC